MNKSLVNETEQQKNTPNIDSDNSDKRIAPDMIKKEGRRLKTLSPMACVVPYIMKHRNGSSNFIKDSICVDRIDEYIREKKDQGMSNFTLMHVLMAAYIRAVSQKPGINRFIRGQKVYARNNIEICLTIKKEMSLEAPDTCVKAFFYPDATAYDVYQELDRIVNEYRASPGGDFDETAKALTYIPGVFLKFTVWLLNLLDYFGGLPRFLTKLSPFHGSFFVTSMGSLGIPSIFHHLYDFGNVPLFLSFGAKYRKNVIMDDGSVKKKSYVDISIVTDERICDGYYFASALKFIKNILKNPWVLDEKPEKVFDDIK